MGCRHPTAGRRQRHADPAICSFGAPYRLALAAEGAFGAAAQTVRPDARCPALRLKPAIAPGLSSRIAPAALAVPRRPRPPDPSKGR